MRIFESFGSFIPIVFIFIIFLYIGGEYTLPYMTKDYVYTQKFSGLEKVLFLVELF